MESQEFQLQQYMQLNDHIIRVEPVGVVDLEVGTYGKERKIISVLGIALWKTCGMGWEMKVSSTHYLISAPDAVVCDNLYALPGFWMGSRIF
jgi:hypothetical protein